MASPRSNVRLWPLAALLFSTGSALPSQKHYAREPGAASTYTSLGCFVDSGSRVLPSKLISTHDMTAAKCADNCAGYDYFGTQWSSECYCGSNAPAEPAPASECNMPCSGNPDETCGAGMRLNVYKFDPTPAAPAPVISGYEYKGCYTDNVPQRVLAGATVTEHGMTLEKCAATCSAGGYALFGVEYESECYCGTTLDIASVKVSEGECSMVCSGDRSQRCGGPGRINVYQNPAPVPGTGPGSPESVGEFRYASCWTDKVDDRSLKAVDWRTDDMTVEKCADRCKDYAYFGLEYSRECYCGDDLLGSSAPEKECGMLCMGDANAWCGGPDRLNLYTKSAASTASTSATISDETTAPESTTTAEPDLSTTASDDDTALTTSTTTTSQGPDLTTITSCPPEPTYNGTPERCYASGRLPSACGKLASSINSRSLSMSVSACKGALTRYGMTPVPAATACFPTSIAAVPAATAASSIASSVYACLNAPTVSLLCQSDAACVTKTYTVGQVPTPTPTIGVDLLNGDGTFESGTLGNWVVGASTNLVSTSVTGARPHSGSLGLLMRYLNVNGGGNSLTYNLPVVPGKQYEWNVYYSHTNPASATSLYLYVYPDTIQTSFDVAQLYQSPANVWGTRTLTFYATASWVQLVLNVGGNVNSANDVYIDDITFKRLA